MGEKIFNKKFGKIKQANKVWSIDLSKSRDLQDLDLLTLTRIQA